MIYKIKTKFRFFTQKLGAIGITGLVLGILVLFNYVISFFPARLDLTENKIYSLSSATKEILSELGDIVSVKLFISKDLPNRLLPTKQEVENILAEFERVGKGNIYIQTSEDEQEADSLGIPSLQFSGIEKDKFEVSSGFFGGVFLFGGKSEIIPVFEEGANFEYQFVSAINRLTRKEIPKVGIVTGHSEKLESTQIAKQLLSRDFEVRNQEILAEEGEEFDFEAIKNLKALIIIGAGKEWNEQEKKILEEFIDKGGSVLFALNGVEVGDGLIALPAEHNLDDFFAKYGLKLNSDLIVSALNEIASFRTQQGAFFTPYPFWVRVRSEGFNKDIAAIAQLETAVFPWASSISIDKGDKGNMEKAYKLIETVEQSYAVEGNINLDPTQKFDFSTPSAGSGEKIIAAAAQLKNSRIVLIGDSDFVSDNRLQQSQENAVLFLNLVDWLASDGKLSSIRARESAFRPLVELDENFQQIVKYGVVLIAPALLGILGLLRLVRRK